MWIYFSINDIINWKYNINSLKGDAMIKTVMFDLDDTVFDHKQSRLCALNALKNENKGICNIPLEDLEKEHEILLSGNYTKVLDKTLTMRKSMIERTYLLFKRYGITLSNDAAIKYTDIYKQAYENNRRATPKVKELIEILKQSVKVGIVSNGLFDIQVEKVKICQIEDIIDYMVFS
jgi:putative hydrolase of the HAD superfamily